MERTGWFNSVKVTTSLIISAGLLAACEKAPRHYDILPDSKQFQQAAEHVPRKVDILWVIDNSGSMATSQANIAANFQSFINRFNTLNYDFHMAVTTTQAYRALFPPASNAHFAHLRNGTPGNPSGYTILHGGLDPDTLEQAFIQNITQGINGSGDERAFQSIAATLTSPANAGFLRDGAFLAVIIVSDEDDFSHNSSAPYDSRYHTLHNPEDYLTVISDATGLQPVQDFSVNTIAIFDNACWQELTDSFKERLIANRYRALSELTDGVTASLCGDFGESLELISASIIELAAVFYLDREPRVESIVVSIDGQLVANSELDGWTYLPEENAIRFHGTAVPPQGSSVKIHFDPVSLKN